MKLKGLLSLTALAFVAGLGVASAQELVVWHDKGDDGIAMFAEIGAQFGKDHPGVTIKSLSFPTDQWFSRSIAAVNTGTSPDLLFNDNFRIARIQQTTGKLHDFEPDLGKLSESDRAALSDADIEASRYQGKLIMLPTQRILVGLGARTSWLKATGESFPGTWDDALRIARKFQDNDPDGNGQNDTYGFASQAGDPAVLHQMLEFFGFGAGLTHIAVDADGKVVLDEPRNAQMVIEHLKLLSSYNLASPETRSHTFTDMYQLIEGRRVGFFRVGDWNVRKWNREGLEGDFEVGPLPALFEGEPRRLVVHGMRSAGVPENGKNPDLSAEFARFMLSADAQAISMKHMGSAVRSDLDLSELPANLAFFGSGKFEISPNDFPESVHAWYPQFKDVLYRELMAGVENNPADWDAWIKEVAGRLQTSVDELKAKT
jgi:multiple sugar transport system substrate-binding protein